MSTQKNLITLCFATVFTLGLAACGGGGGGDAPVTGMTDDTMVPTMVVPTIVGEVIPSGTTFMLPAGLVADITVSDVEEGASVPVPGVGIFECVTGPCTVVVAANVVTTTGDIEVVSLADDLSADVLTALASAIAPAGLTPATPATPEQKTAAAATKVTAITAEAEQETEAGIGGSDAPITTDEQMEGEYNLAIKHGETSITVEGATVDDDVEFMQAMDFGDGRTMHVRAMEADSDGNVVEEVVIVSTDIDAPKATPFAMVMGQELDVTTDTTNDPQGGDHTSEAFAIKQDLEAVRALVKSSAFTAGTVATLTFTNNDTGTDDMDEAFETAGTYNGAMGTYRCNGAAECTVTLDAKGAITGMTAGWIFTPDTGATSDVADTDYLNYGFWLMRTTDADGVLTYDEVQTFAGSSIDASASVTDVEGMASYEGGAVGVYVKNVIDSEGEIDTATSGHFSADASLMAYFGGNDVAVSKAFTVTGTIDNFALAGGEENAWSVALKGDITEDTGVIADGGTANGGGAEGSFSATFHGLTPLTEAEDDVNARVAPGAVVGEFNANFSNGTVAGGFGARKQ